MLSAMWVSAAAAAAGLAPGAVRLPAGLTLSAPFPEGTEFMVSCDYAPCTPAHKGTQDPGGINDHYALDFIRNQRGNGRGQEVSTVLPGTVVYADWGQHGRRIYGRLVMVRHTAPDGQTLTSFYAHLSAIQVQVGDVLQTKAVIGKMGGSAWGKDDKLAPHLHLGIHAGAAVRGGPVGGQAVLPEPMDGTIGLTKEGIYTAGDGVLEAEYLVVDNEDPGFAVPPDQPSQLQRVQPTEREQYIYGTPETWSGPEGYGPESRFVSVSTASARATWTAEVNRAGAWQVQVYSPDSAGAQCSAVVYRLEPEGPTLLIDQASTSGWQPGPAIQASQGQQLQLSLESSCEGTPTALDAVRFVWRGPAQSAD
jgi:murein DD-endopeptidase MepM/ murein hydrolase activator NlpD